MVWYVIRHVKEKPSHTIFIGTLGRTPQVVCETIWALANRDKPIVPDEIIAISMDNFAVEARKSIFGEGRGWQLMLSNLRKAKVKIDGKLVFKDITIATDSIGPIDDLRSVKDNERCANYLFGLVRKYTDSPHPVRIVFSLSGGRKSLSAIATSVMSLLARPEDMLIHLIANSEFEDGEYHFPRRGVGYSLFEVPFVRTRGLLKRVKIPKIGSFDECLQLTQGGISTSIDYPAIVLDTDNGMVRFGAEIIPREDIDACRFMLLWLLCTYKRSNRPIFEEAIWRVKQEKIDSSRCCAHVPSWFYAIRDKPRIQPITKLISETMKILESHSSMSASQIAALLFPRPPNRHQRNLCIGYPVDKLTVQQSAFSAWLKSQVDEIVV